MIVLLEVPISDYYGERVFFKRFFFDVNEGAVTKQRVLDSLHSKDERDRVLYPNEYDSQEILEAIGVIETCKEFPIFEARHYMITTHVDTKFGSQPLSLTKVDLIQI